MVGETGPICVQQQGDGGRDASGGEGVRGGGRSAEMWRWAEEEEGEA